ncbi:hypothetical protein C8R45DRAFT_70961 [Mycena sanguinolenta]|nr:hypothetical protein C8R45DRAFT_70961 [Mycena sanguinolenta]
MRSRPINKALFQKQMGMVSDGAAYRKFRITLKEIAVQCLDIERTKGLQKPESWEAFKSELMRRFPLFGDPNEGAERLESAVFFACQDLKHIREQASKLSRSNQKNDKKAPKTNSEFESTPPPNSTSPQELRAPLDAASRPVKSESESSPTINTRHAVDVQAFLEGCNPSLAYLLPSFIQAGIDERDWLWAMQEWPKSALYDFLNKNFNIKEDGSADEKKIAVQALLIHFAEYWGGENAE